MGKTLAVMSAPASSVATTTSTSGSSVASEAAATRVQPEPAAPSQQRQRKAPTPKQAPREEAFDVNEYIEDVGDVQFEDLALDVHMRLGQTRKVDDRHALTLVQEFQLNPPHLLEMTVWMDQSVFLATLP